MEHFETTANYFIDIYGLSAVKEALSRAVACVVANKDAEQERWVEVAQAIMKIQHVHQRRAEAYRSGSA